MKKNNVSPSIVIILSGILLLASALSVTPQTPTPPIAAPEKRCEAIWLDYIASLEGIRAKHPERKIQLDAKIAATKKCLSDLRREFGLNGKDGAPDTPQKFDEAGNPNFGPKAVSVEVEPTVIPASSADSRDHWIFYQSKNLEWRWRRLASNGRIVGSSSESYTRFIYCRINAQRNGWKEGRAFRTMVVKYKGSQFQ
ncbi:MAG TPA: hypothetical protein VNP98_17340 [Chthoniobacterales bacterium]|nr:hypothetical protein [Chthoniobacterales bacterium]